MNNGATGSHRDRRGVARPVLARQFPAHPERRQHPALADAGPALFANCRITDPEGRPIPGVEVDVWQASPVGLYENQDPDQADMNLRGRFLTDEDGRFWFRSVKPAGYPVPTHGPTGELLRAQRRHPYRPAHLHVLGYKPGYRTLITQVFVDDDERLQSDVVFGVTRHLIGNYRRHDATRRRPRRM